MIFAIDLEGVLAPEIWPALGNAFDVADLHLTTRDLGDFDELMRRRVAATRSKGLTLKQLQAAFEKAGMTTAGDEGFCKIGPGGEPSC